MKVIKELSEVNMYYEAVYSDGDYESFVSKSYNENEKTSIVIYDDYKGDFYRCGLVEGRKGLYIDVCGFRYYLTLEDVQKIELDKKDMEDI